MVDVECGDVGDDWVWDDVGCVELVVEFDFDDCCGGGCVCEGEECGGGGDFEEVGVEVGGLVEDF